MRITTISLIPAALFLTSCGPGREPQTGATWEIERRYENEGAALTVKISRARITTTDHVDLVLEALTQEGQEVQFPETPEKLGEFTVTDSDSTEPRLVEEGRLLLEQRLELEPFLPGEYEIPALTVRFGESETIETETLTVRVDSVLPAAEETPDIKEIAPPVALPGFSPWVYALAALLVLGAVGFYYWRKRRLARARTETQLLPHQVALQALRELMEEDLIGKGQPKQFYLRISAILRHYIEDRFGLHAPESTTEEFLAGLRRDNSFNPRQKELLKEFLEHCDMVKFAEYQPERQEMDDTINTCAQFIAETRPFSTEGGLAYTDRELGT